MYWCLADLLKGKAHESCSSASDVKTASLMLRRWTASTGRCLVMSSGLAADKTPKSGRSVLLLSLTYAMTSGSTMSSQHFKSRGPCTWSAGSLLDSRKRPASVEQAACHASSLPSDSEGAKRAYLARSVALQSLAPLSKGCRRRLFQNRMRPPQAVQVWLPARESASRSLHASYTVEGGSCYCDQFQSAFKGV